jgi:hypothetical protein
LLPGASHGSCSVITVPRLTFEACEVAFFHSEADLNWLPFDMFPCFLPFRPVSLVILIGSQLFRSFLLEPLSIRINIFRDYPSNIDHSLLDSETHLVTAFAATRRDFRTVVSSRLTHFAGLPRLIRHLGHNDGMAIVLFFFRNQIR